VISHAGLAFLERDAKDLSFEIEGLDTTTHDWIARQIEARKRAVIRQSRGRRNAKRERDVHVAALPLAAAARLQRRCSNGDKNRRHRTTELSNSSTDPNLCGAMDAWSTGQIMFWWRFGRRGVNYYYI
jgi:hypothetical protein